MRYPHFNGTLGDVAPGVPFAVCTKIMVAWTTPSRMEVGIR